PSSWTDTKLIEGYPGKFVVMARKSGSKWYIAGINGELNPKNVQIDLKAFGGKKATIYTDGTVEFTFEKRDIQLNSDSIEMKPFGGFVIVIE
ncbi:MAG: glycoside hydrolase family 97 protein, partial [Chitinophagaceae bacterium]